MRAREARIEERVNDVVMGANNFFPPPFHVPGWGEKGGRNFVRFFRCLLLLWVLTLEAAAKEGERRGGGDQKNLNCMGS